MKKVNSCNNEEIKNHIYVIEPTDTINLDPELILFQKLEHYEKAVELNPDFNEVYNNWVLS